ncbi:MAG: LysM peptidoglycan-binding domain-containing protein [Desulfobacterales bacterium]|nr:LysM peptidoglycan-binding domain-containing protein [Desulfobacterales bacterium]
MRPKKNYFLSGFKKIFFIIWFLVPFSANSAILHKSYIVEQDQGTDILCDPYIVQKNDYVLKLFSQKGEISHQDFPEFLNIFARINPHISDVNKICPGQHILIPLKKLSPNTLTGQSSGIVTIPFVTISNIAETIQTYSKKYKVHRGDCISKIISRSYGIYGTEAYDQGVKLFKLINPDVTDLNRIYAGQTINIPEPTLQDQPWYKSLFDSSGNIRKNKIISTENGFDITGSEPLQSQATINDSISVFAQVASILEAKLLNEGKYHFPKQGENDLELDLSYFPLLTMGDRFRILFSKNDEIPKADVELIKSFWRNLKIVSISSEPSVKEVLDAVVAAMGDDFTKKQVLFSDNGIEVDVRAEWIIYKPTEKGNKAGYDCINLIKSSNERTPDSICRYLEEKNITIKDIIDKEKNSNSNTKVLRHKISGSDIITIKGSDRKHFVNELLLSMGYNYSQNVNITFPYAGIQVEAVSNLLQKNDGTSLLIDFGDFYGDAILAIKNSGLNIIQLKDENKLDTFISIILESIGDPYVINPNFTAVESPIDYNTRLTIPGFLVKAGEKSRIMIVRMLLHDEIVQFLQEQGIKIIMIG